MSKGTYADRVRIDIEETGQFEAEPRERVDSVLSEFSVLSYEAIYSHNSLL